MSCRNDGSKAFPTPYYFVSAEETEALARRAARFQEPSTALSGPAPPIGVGGWFADDDERPMDAAGSEVAPGQVGRKKMKGKGGLGYSGEEVIEVDPVSGHRRPASVMLTDRRM